MSHSSTSTGITIGTAPNGQRSVAVRTSTTVRTGPEFREQLDRACRGSEAPASRTPGPITYGEPCMQVRPCSGQAPTVQELRTQLSALIEQLMQLLERAERGQVAGRSCAPGPPGPRSHAPAPRQCVPVSEMHAPPHVRATPERVFDVRSAADPQAAVTRQLVMRGGIAAAPVTDGAKLDEGVRRLASFLDQIGEHVRAGGTFTDEQLQSIADETIAVYYEAIRPTVHEGDLGDFTPAGRDGVLDLGASTRSISIQASVETTPPADAASTPIDTEPSADQVAA